MEIYEHRGDKENFVEATWITKKHISLLKKFNELGVDCIIADKPNSINVNI